MRQDIGTIIAAAIIAVAAGCPVARAQDSHAGTLAVTVTDAATRAPIPSARVLLQGPLLAAGFTDAKGTIRFDDVPPGLYRARLFAPSYAALTTSVFDIEAGRATTLAVALVRNGGPKTIAVVSARPSVSVETNAIGPDSAQRTLSSDLIDALGKLSGVTIAASSDDTDAQETISLDGHDPSQTALTLDGIPLNAPGTAGDLRVIGTDLFAGARVDHGPQVGGLGGGVAFSTLSPTLAWQGQATLGVGSNGRWNDAFSETGTIGRLGLVAMHTDRLIPSLVDGMRYLDTSGLEYVHDGDASNEGELFKAEYEFPTPQLLTLTALDSSRSAALACLRISGPLPCGYGPGNEMTSSFRLWSLADRALVGTTTFQAAIFGTTMHVDHDLLDRYVDGAAEPTGFAMETGTHGLTAQAVLPVRGRHTLSVQAYAVASDQRLSPLVPQAQPYASGERSGSYSMVQLSDTMRANDRLTWKASFGLGDTTSGGAAALGSVGASLRTGANGTLDLAYAASGTTPQLGRPGILSDPAQLEFDCSAGIAYGEAPGDQPGASSSATATTTYRSRLRGGMFELSFYRQVQNDVVLPAEVNGTILAAEGFLPPSYLAAVQALYASPAGCAAPSGSAFGPQNLYFSMPIGGVRRVYQGVDLTGFLTVGRLVVQPFYDVTSSTIASNDPRIVNPYSIVIPGAQVPDVPLHRAGVVLDVKAPHSAVEWLADAQYTGANNPQHLPAYTSFDAGASATFARGTLTLAVSNLTNVFAGTFASPQNAVPYVTAGGFSVPTIARPLAPRTVFVTYTVHLGTGRAPEAAPPVAPDVRGPRRPFFAALPSSPPNDPFALDEGNGRCTAATAARARPILDGLRAYAARLDAAKTAAGYPPSFAAPAIAGVMVRYHGMGSSYALSVVPSGRDATRALFSCAIVHRASEAEAKARGLYVPEAMPFFVPRFVFMPTVGFYLVAIPQAEGRESFRVYALPKVPPPHPFAVVGGPACTSELRTRAAALLPALHAAIAAGRTIPDFTVATERGTAGTWYRLTPTDPSDLAALLSCAHVSVGTAEELAARGYGGEPPPSLMYAPALGLYVERREPRVPQPAGSPPP
jgi:hypothetical protein